MPNQKNSRDILDKLEKLGALSTQGKNWVINALDPFHDYDVGEAGYPDIESAATTVQCVKKDFTISAPTGLSAGANWDCHVAMFPNMQPGGLVAGNPPFNVALSMGGGTATAYSACPHFLGGLVANSVAAGNPTFVDYNVDSSSVVIPTILSSQNLNCMEYLNGKARIVGMGFEVWNTTAELYKQGSVTVYRQPSSTTLTQFQSQTST